MFCLGDHTADVAIHVEAADLPELLAESARALGVLLLEDVTTVRVSASRSIALEQRDPALLLLDWLTEVLHLMESGQLLCREFDVAVHDGRLTAEVRGEPFDAARHRRAHEVKAITYHALSVEPTADGWQGDFVVDV